MGDEQSNRTARQSSRLLAARGEVGKTHGNNAETDSGLGRGRRGRRGRGHHGVGHSLTALEQTHSSKTLTDSERVVLGKLLAKAIDPTFANDVLKKLDWKPMPLTAVQSSVLEKWQSLFPILLEHDENSPTGFSIPLMNQMDVDRQSSELPVFVVNLLQCLKQARRLFPEDVSQQKHLQSVITPSSIFTVAVPGTVDVTPMDWTPLLNQGEMPFHWRNGTNAKNEITTEECRLYSFKYQHASLQKLLNRLQSMDGHEVSMSHQVFHGIVGKSFEELVLCFDSLVCLQDHAMPCLEPIKYDVGSYYTNSILRPDEQASLMIQGVNRAYNLIGFFLAEYKTAEFPENVQKCRLLTYANYVTFVRLARLALKSVYLYDKEEAWKHALDRLARCEFCLPLIYGHGDGIVVELLYVKQLPESIEATSSDNTSHYSSNNVTVSWFDIGAFSLNTPDNVRSAMTLIRNLRDYLFDVLRIDRLVSANMVLKCRALWDVRIPAKSRASSRPSSATGSRTLSTSPTRTAELLIPLGQTRGGISRVASDFVMRHFREDFEILSRFDSETAVIRASLKKDSKLRNSMKNTIPRVVVVKVGATSEIQMEHELMTRKHLHATFQTRKKLTCNVVMPETYCTVSLDDENVAIIMEDCGSTLADVDIGTWDELRDISLALLYTLIQLHSVNVIHCDVNVWNVAVWSLSEHRENISSLSKNWSHRMHGPNAEMATVLLDFGLSEVIVDNHLPRGNRGAEGFIAPEVASGDEFYFAADIWSAAASLKWVQEHCLIKNIPVQFTLLLSSMQNESPLQRPTAQQAYSQLLMMK